MFSRIREIHASERRFNQKITDLYATIADYSPDADETKDLMIASLILHDGLKKGIEEERYTRFDHPLIIGDYLKGNKDNRIYNICIQNVTFYE